MDDPSVGYSATARDGSVYDGPDPISVGQRAYFHKAPGVRRRPVLVCAIKQGGETLYGREKHAKYSVPIGWYAPDRTHPCRDCDSLTYVAELTYEGNDDDGPVYLCADCRGE